MSDYYKRQDIDSQRMWGNSGSLVFTITQIFKRSGTYSIIILASATLFCLFCFHVASRSADGSKR